MESQPWVSFESSEWWRKWWACDPLHSWYKHTLETLGFWWLPTGSESLPGLRFVCSTADIRMFFSFFFKFLKNLKCFLFLVKEKRPMKPFLFPVSPELTFRGRHADVLSWGSTSSSTCLGLLFPTWSPPPQSTGSVRLHSLPTPLLPGLPSPWRRSWRAAWPPWIGFLSWPCRRPSARRTLRVPTGPAWARRAPCWILTPRWTRRKCSSIRTASRRTATPASSRSPSTARQRRRWHWARSTSGSVITFHTTGRQAVAGRWEKEPLEPHFKLMRQIWKFAAIVVIVGPSLELTLPSQIWAFGIGRLCNSSNSNPLICWDKDVSLTRVF